MIFSNVSFVGSQALADELMSMGPKVAEGVMVTQVVPLPSEQVHRRAALPGAAAAAIRWARSPSSSRWKATSPPMLLIEGLRKAGRDLTTETLVDALENLRGVDLGVGAPMSFGMSEHQASHKVWGTVLDANGVFRNIDLE